MKSLKGSGVYNVVVIGGGTAGLVTAAGTAGLGGRVALVERNRMGGDCLNFGCVPSKALISSARLAHQIQHAEKWGLERQQPRLQLGEVFSRMRERRAQIAPNDSQERFESLGVDVFRGEAKFNSPNELEVNGTKLHARHFVIATGTRATIPPIPGLDSTPYFTNETIFDEMHRTPDSLAILGGGPIGCEMAQAFCRLGVKVTLLHRGERLLEKEDPEVSSVLQKCFEEEGVNVITGADAQSANRQDDGIEISYRGNAASAIDERLVASALLIAAGRTPNFGALHLEAAGVKFSKRGVETNAYLQTSRPHIYAAGDVVGPYLFTHMADYHARIVVRNILMPLSLLRQKIDYSVVPWCTFVDPEIARVGLNESEARQKNVEYEVVRQDFVHVDRAVVESRQTGFAKILLQRGSDRILGITIVADHAGELIHEFILAMKNGIGLRKIGSAIHVYPTFSEVARKLADQQNKRRLTPFARRVFRWLYRRQRGGER